jgi:hypothetical protein
MCSHMLGDFSNMNFEFVSNLTSSVGAVWMRRLAMLRVLLQVMKLCPIMVLVTLMAVAGCGRNERMDLIYNQRCVNCHGPNGRGDGLISASLATRPPDFRDTVQHKSNSQIRRIISDGRGVMPAFDPALRPSEINDMLQMVRFLSREGRELAWWEKYDTLIAAHCSIPWEAALGLEDAPENQP